MHTPIQPTLFDLAPRKPLRTLAERPLREWPVGERPVERLITVGPSALSDVELLAVLLMGNGGANPVALAQQLISTFGGWHGLAQASLRSCCASLAWGARARPRSKPCWKSRAACC